MHQYRNSGEVILQLGQAGLTFAIAPETTLTFANAASPIKPWMRIIASFFVSIGLWSLPIFSHAAQTTGADLVARTNQIRVEHGLTALTNNAALEQAATAKANDMIANHYFAHTSPTGKTPWSFFSTAGYRFTSAAENLALEPNATTDPTAAWMSSSTHRQNILDPKFQDIGIAIVSGTYKGVPTTFVVQLFGSRKSTISTPTPSPIAAITPKVNPPTVAPPATPPPLIVDAPAVPTPTPSLLPEITLPTIPVQKEPAVVLGATTPVIHNPHSTKVLDAELNGKITAMLVQVMGIYFVVIAAFGLLQVTQAGQKTLICLPPIRNWSKSYTHPKKHP